MAPPADPGPARRPLISREFIEEHRRGRFVVAAAEILHEFGRPGVTTATVIGLAGGARNSFYEVFSSVDDCIAFGMALAGAEIFAALEAEDGQGEWPAEVHRSIEGFYGAIVAAPLLAELLLVHGAGSRIDRGREAYRASGDRFAALFGREGAEAPAGSRAGMSETLARCLSRAVVSLAARRLAEGRPASLAAEAEPMAALVCGYRLGFEEATEAIAGLEADPARS